MFASSSFFSILFTTHGNKMSTTLLRYLTKRSSTARFLNSVINSRNKSFDSNSNIIKSAIPDVEIPNITIPEFVFENSGKFPHKVAVECAVTGRKYTYDELRIKARNLNKGLRKKLKLKKGDVVAELLPNVPEYPICMLGALQAGLTVTTINPLYTPEELKRQLVDANAKVIIALGASWPTVQAAVQLLSNSVPILTIKTKESESTPEGAINFKEFTDTNFDIEDVPPGNASDVVLMPYSSGTTGLPKGVEHTHHSLIANICMINSSYLKLSENTTETHQDVIPAALPFFHIYGLVVILLNQLRNNSKIVSLPQFTPELFANTLAKHKPHVLYTVPPIILFMTNNPLIKKEYLQSVRSITSGAAPLGALDEEKLLQKAEKPINMLQGYGLTEATVDLLTAVHKKKELGLAGSVGEIVPNAFAKVVPSENVSGEPLGPYQPGELLIKGPHVMKGYYNKPDETKETFLNGWLRTGDMVYYDENKMFYITDRLKELIKVKGFQVAPAELEEIIRSYPDVADAAVIGVPHSTHGEVPRAYVVTKSNTKINTTKLEEYVAGKVANYKQIKGGIAVVESIPKTASGKIMRKQLKSQFEQENK